MKPIRISANGRYFTDEDEHPFFWLGDTAWELFRCFTLEDARAILERRKAQGFTVLQVMLTGVGDGSAPDLAGQTPWLDHDPARPNEAYFQNMDAVVAQATSAEMILVVGRS